MLEDPSFHLDHWLRFEVAQTANLHDEETTKVHQHHEQYPEDRVNQQQHRPYYIHIGARRQWHESVLGQNRRIAGPEQNWALQRSLRRPH